VATLKPSLDRAAHAMTELEMLDAAYTLRRLGLAGSSPGAPATPRRHARPCLPAVRRRRDCGTAASGRMKVSPVWRWSPQRCGGRTSRGARATSLDAHVELQAAIARHARRFPPRAHAAPAGAFAAGRGARPRRVGSTQLERACVRPRHRACASTWHAAAKHCMRWHRATAGHRGHSGLVARDGKDAADQTHAACRGLGEPIA
jgi:hypothetical protein